MVIRYTNKRFWYKNGGGAKRVLLPKQYMQAFANKQITCVEYDSLTDDQEREIFQVLPSFNSKLSEFA